jgi:polyisoprenoid-binding protein YceI
MTQAAQTSTPTTAWRLDPVHTNVEFAVRHLMISTIHGHFGDVSGTAVVPGNDFSRAEIEARVGVASVDTRDAQRDGFLKSSDFFDVEAYPAITFKSRRIEAAQGDDHTYRVVGDFTLHGVTKEIVLDASFGGIATDSYKKRRAGFSATATINRKDFGLGWNQLLETGGVAVGEDVKLLIDAELIAQPA